MAATPQRTHQSSASRQQVRAEPIVPVGRILQALQVSTDDLKGDRVTVQGAGLRALLRAFARYQPFDPSFYSDQYPDVEAARLAGIVTSLHEHFVSAGFLEGRLPSAPRFDPGWYLNHYPDLAATFETDDTAGLRNHFYSSGLAEGRAGTEAALTEPHPLVAEFS